MNETKANQKIAIIDYGAGNLFSVKNALKFLGADGGITADKAALRAADKLILPGVGAFPDAMRMLDERGLTDVIRVEARKKPLLGICLGMQILFEKGYEFEETEGLGLIDGYVDRIQAPGLKIPHMGWDDLTITNPSPMTKTVKNGDMVYFVHSYKAVTDGKNISLAAAYGQLIPALVRKGGIYGAQFHPEKSGPVGLGILQSFLEL
ncbi:MAG: imidazole glycerol phosphate synthase subunit HisH [Clostridiales Family XIII bacterium]|jgi:glutamine amidotransferase|nr:imidazole glycerol phosphate synthase subunit HisH [Clostridiales Family XIII bacterium]